MSAGNSLMPRQNQAYDELRAVGSDRLCRAAIPSRCSARNIGMPSNRRG